MIVAPLDQGSVSTTPEHRQLDISRYDNESIYIAECEVGFGVFANRAIQAGERILVFGGPIIDFAETKRRGLRECMPLQIGWNQYFDTQPPGIFVNHSCEPNAGIRRDCDLVALRPIQQHEEIRFDYSTTMDEKSYTMRCLCGASSCRQRVADFCTLPVALQEKYLSLEIVMSFIVQKQSLRVHHFCSELSS